MGMHLWGGRPGAVSKRNFSLVRVVAARIIGTPPDESHGLQGMPPVWAQCVSLLQIPNRHVGAAWVSLEPWAI